MALLKKKKKIDRKLVIASKTAPFSYVEAYKSLRTNLNFVSVNNRYKKIIITSAVPGEGKSNVAINLSITLAEGGNKVLLVDCDLRKPVVHKYLHIKADKRNGLTAVLSGHADAASSIVRFSDLGIDVLTAGAMPPNPAELISSDAMGDLIAELESEYDYIIFDTPPSLLVTDASVLSKYVDGVIMVIRQKFSTKENIKAAQKNLENVQANIIGCVLNDFDTKKRSMGGGYYYYYDYGYGYGYGHREK